MNGPPFSFEGMMLRHFAVAAAVALLLAAGGVAGAQDDGRMTLKRSDVVFMGRGNAELYDRYGTTVVSWGGRPSNQKQGTLNWYWRGVREARDRGIRYLPGAAFRTAFAGMIDYDPDFMDSVCRTLDGEPILVPWLWDHKYKGHPAYWFCTNAPGYRAYLKYQMERAFEAGADGLHIDDYGGTSGTHTSGGCFCPYCMAAFRDYLRERVPRETLAGLGIEDLATFDYGEFLRSRGVTTEQFRKYVNRRPEKLPLSHAFVDFQLEAATAWVAQYRRYCEGLVGHPLGLCVNSSVSSPQSLRIAPVVTFFSGEVRHEAGGGTVSFRPIWTFKLGDALERPIACTAAGQDWAFVNAQGKPGLVRAWIAQAYAFGHQFMPPVRQWCYTKQKGTHWYEPDPREFAYLCRFVRQHAELFDGYEAVARVGLLYSNAALRRYKRQAMDACAALARMNVPFKLVLAGDDWLDARLEAGGLAGLKALVYTEPTYLDAAQQAVLDGAKDMAVLWPDEERLLELAPPMIRVEGASDVTVVPRARPHDPKAPFVCHLVNRSYSLATDSRVVQRGFVVRLSDDLFGEPIARATLYAPRAEPISLELRRSGDGAEITVPELDLWAILSLERR